MARTRAQTASQKGRNSPENEDLLYEAPRGASVRRSPRLKTSQPSPNLPPSTTRQEPKRTIEHTRDFGIEPSAKRRRLSNRSASEDSQSGPATNNCDPIEYWARKGHWPHKYLSPAWNMLNMPWHGNGPRRFSDVSGRILRRPRRRVTRGRERRRVHHTETRATKPSSTRKVPIWRLQK